MSSSSLKRFDHQLDINKYIYLYHKINTLRGPIKQSMVGIILSQERAATNSWTSTTSEKRMSDSFKASFHWMRNVCGRLAKHHRAKTIIFFYNRVEVSANHKPLPIFLISLGKPISHPFPQYTSLYRYSSCRHI